MGSDISWLITLTDGDRILRVAFKIDVRHIKEGEDWGKYPMEPENREKIFRMLPSHVQSFGNIVSIDPIFEVTIVK